MAADLEDRNRLSNNQLFIDRVTGACLVTVNTVGSEASKPDLDWSRKRNALLHTILNMPAEAGLKFARAAAGGAMANTFADAAGVDDVKQAAITDTTIQNYVIAAWDTIAGVMPWERGG